MSNLSIPNWETLKPKLEKKTKREIITSIEKQFQLSASNQLLIIASLKLLDQETIDRLYNMRLQALFQHDAPDMEVMLSHARLIIGEYQLGGGTSATQVEMMLTVIQNVVGMMRDYGAAWETIVESILQLADQLVDLICKQDISLTSTQMRRLQQIEFDASDVGYGLSEDLSDYFCEISHEP